MNFLWDSGFRSIWVKRTRQVGAEKNFFDLPAAAFVAKGVHRCLSALARDRSFVNASVCSWNLCQAFRDLPCPFFV